MLRSSQELNGFTVRGTDGEIGQVDELFFDDEKWTIRYVVVRTGGWLGRRVLISPMSVSRTDWTDKTVALSLTRDRIRDSPDADLNAPISRDYERAFYGYYGYPLYWGGPGYWGPAASPAALASPAAAGTAAAAAAGTPAQEARESHLRSSRAVMGYHIQAADGLATSTTCSWTTRAGRSGTCGSIRATGLAERLCSCHDMRSRTWTGWIRRSLSPSRGNRCGIVLSTIPAFSTGIASSVSTPTTGPAAPSPLDAVMTHPHRTCDASHTAVSWQAGCVRPSTRSAPAERGRPRRAGRCQRGRAEDNDGSNRAAALGHCGGIHPRLQPRAGAGDDEPRDCFDPERR